MLQAMHGRGPHKEESRHVPWEVRFLPHVHVESSMQLKLIRAHYL